jgi:hypothetical protein
MGKDYSQKGIEEEEKNSNGFQASIMIMISQGKNSEGLRHKEDHSLLGMKIYFMVIVFIVLTLDISKQTVPMWSHVTLSVTNVITMDT